MATVAGNRGGAGYVPDEDEIDDDCCGGPDDNFREWLRELEEDVVQDEFGYEPGEFTVYWSHWQTLYDEGLSPREAWQRALDGFAAARREERAAREANYARIVAEDEAAIAMARRDRKATE